MKGRTSCPKCKNEFVLDIPDDGKKHEITCPKCKEKFTIKTKCDDTNDKECYWEEHGEPRKTILSSIRPKTNKPTIAAILLICVFAIGITTAVFSEAFIETSLNVAKDMGLKGDVSISITNITNTSIENATISIAGRTGYSNENGIFYINEIEPGIKTVNISKTNYTTHTQEILVTPFFISESTVKLKEGIGQAEKTKFDAMGCTFILAVFSVLALIGVITCFRRQHVDVAIAGSFIGIFTFGFFLIGSIISIIAFVIIIKSRDEFENGKKGKIF
jgi:hypothetical protein